MPGLGKIEIFLEVAKQRSFAKGARMLGISGPAASKQVAALEDELGVKLLRRTTRLVSLTEEGARYYERARIAVDELKEAASDIQDSKIVPKGNLRISVPQSFGHMHLLPALSSFAKKYPDLVMDIALDDRMVDVMADGFDVVIRIGVLADSQLIAKRLAPCPIYVVASPEYLAKHGVPQTPAELKKHRIIVYTNLGAAVMWKYRDSHGKQGSVHLDAAALRANTAEMMLQAALDSVGIAILPSFSVAVHMQAGQLIRLLPEYETYPARDITALMPSNRYRTAKVKLLLDWLTHACAAIPAMK